MNEKLSQRPEGAKEKACAPAEAHEASRVRADHLAGLCERFPEFGWLGEQLATLAPGPLNAARLLVELHGFDPQSPEVARALGLRPAGVPTELAGEPASDAKRGGAPLPYGLAVPNSPTSVIGLPYPEFAWVGAELSSVGEARLAAAREMVRGGYAPNAPEVAEALGIGPAAKRERTLAADVARRSKRKSGTAPPGKSLEARRTHVAVTILVACFARLHAAPPKLADGTQLSAAAGALLAKAGLVASSGHDGVLERHPRARARGAVVVDAATARRLEGELDALMRGDFSTPDESEAPLPAERVCGATVRNRRRRDDARGQFDQEAKTYARMHRLERAALAAGNRIQNPAGVKPLPLHEGRKARAIAWDRLGALRFLKSLPPSILGRLYQAATDGGRRGRFSSPAMLVYAYYAYILWQSEAPRPTMRRDGFERAVEGLTREALAVAFVWNSHSRAPYHANTISTLNELLEGACLVVRETPNSQRDVYTGTTGWALHVYRVRNAQQLGELLLALGQEHGARDAALNDASLPAEAPS